MSWQPIESAPRNGEIVWVAAPLSMVVAYFYLNAWRNWFKGCNYDTPSPPEAFAPDRIWFEPTHWMPLPSPLEV